MHFKCDRYVDYTEKINFYYDFDLLVSLDVAKGREFVVGELFAIESNVYRVIIHEDINNAEGDKIARSVIMSKVGPFENS